VEESSVKECKSGFFRFRGEGISGGEEGIPRRMRSFKSPATTRGEEGEAVRRRGGRVERIERFCSCAGALREGL
jgi:hypothetical protein